jgi:hypothetical protein
VLLVLKICSIPINSEYPGTPLQAPTSYKTDIEDDCIQFDGSRSLWRLNGNRRLPQGIGYLGLHTTFYVRTYKSERKQHTVPQHSL